MFLLTTMLIRQRRWWNISSWRYGGAVYYLTLYFPLLFPAPTLKLQHESQEYREAKLQQMATGVSRTPAHSSAPFGQGGPDDSNVNSLDSDESLDDDTEVLHMYRKMRVAEIMARKSPTFGEVIHTTRETFVQAIDSVHPGVFVVAHLYEPYLKTCEVRNGFEEFIYILHFSSEEKNVTGAQSYL